MGTKGKWTEKEVLQVRLLMEQGKSDEEIAAIVGRTARAVAERRKRNGWRRENCVDLAIKNRTTWTKHELKFIRLYWRNLTDKKIAAKLRKSAALVRDKRLEMGFKKAYMKKKGLRRGWTYADEETVRRFYGRHSAEDIRRYLTGKHTAAGVRQKAFAMGLKKEVWAGRGRLETIAEYYSRLKGN